MKLTRCDRHPDREAVATFRIIEMPPGTRPLLAGYSPGGTMVDLCEECASTLRVSGKGEQVPPDPSL